MSFRIVRDVTPNKAARFSAVSQRLLQSRSKIALRRSDGLTPVHLPALLCSIEHRGKIGRFISNLEKFFEINLKFYNNTSFYMSILINMAVFVL